MPFSVEYRLGVELSVPVFGCEEKERLEKRVEEVVEEVLQTLSTVPPGSSGTIKVGQNRFLYAPSKLDRGHSAGGVTAAHVMPDEKHKAKLLEDLARKADRREDLPPHLQEIPFVVAYENWETEFREQRLLTALTGSKRWFSNMVPPPINHPPEILAAWNSPWQQLLQEWHYGPDVKFRFDDYGAFSNLAWGKNLSGVLIVHGRYKIQWLPNPFAAEAIREIRLLDLGFPIDEDGTPHPGILGKWGCRRPPASLSDPRSTSPP